MGFNCSRIVVSISVVAGLVLAGPCRAAALPVQITEDHSATGCTSTSPVSNVEGTVVAWQSSCNPAGTNADGSSEIFRAVVGSAPVQLTSGNNCSSTRPSISADGNRVAFESNCDLKSGSNTDGNPEIFVWNNGTLLQRTTSTGCDNLAPSIGTAGTQVAFDSTCNTAGTSNNGRGSEIFRVTAVGAVSLLQLTVDPKGGVCDSTSATIDSTGTLVAFDSDCDLVGKNEDFAIEIFTVTSGGMVKQLTFAPDDSCSSVRPSMSEDGSIVAFQSDCDFTGANAEHGDEIFTVQSTLAIRQVSDAGIGAACANGEPHLASSGHAVVFSGYCKLNGSNADGSVEVFHSGTGLAQGGVLAVTDGAGCSSLGGGVSADGTRVVFDSDCNPATGNADGGVEVFRAGACVCGGPSSRKSPPKAGDALFALRAAVGSASCAACECDVNNDAQVSASDALKLLKAAVGTAGITLSCPQP